jgi:hypothetical protein
MLYAHLLDLELGLALIIGARASLAGRGLGRSGRSVGHLNVGHVCVRKIVADGVVRSGAGCGSAAAVSLAAAASVPLESSL